MEGKESWIDKPETKELLKKLNERAVKQRAEDLQTLKVINALFGNIIVQRREDIHPYGVEISVGSKMFDELKELLEAHDK